MIMMTSKTIAKALVLGLVLGSSLTLVGCGKKKEKKEATEAVYAENYSEPLAFNSQDEDILRDVVMESLEEDK